MGDPYGLRRVVRPKGALPQQAEVLDPHLPLGPDELSIEVERLNVDAASFRQLAQEAGGDEQRISSRVAEIVSARGKMHNPVTGSGGMLIGRVAEVGPEHPARQAVDARDVRPVEPFEGGLVPAGRQGDIALEPCSNPVFTTQRHHRRDRHKSATYNSLDGLRLQEG